MPSTQEPWRQEIRPEPRPTSVSCSSWLYLRRLCHVMSSPITIFLLFRQMKETIKKRKYQMLLCKGKYTEPSVLWKPERTKPGRVSWGKVGKNAKKWDLATWLNLLIFVLLCWCLATFHQSFIKFHQLFLQALSPKEGHTEVRKAEDRWLHASQLCGTDTAIVPSLFLSEPLQPWQKGGTFSLVFRQLKLQVLMEGSDLRSTWNYRFRNVFTNWIIFLHIWFQSVLYILKIRCE